MSSVGKPPTAILKAPRNDLSIPGGGVSGLKGSLWWEITSEPERPLVQLTNQNWAAVGADTSYNGLRLAMSVRDLRRPGKDSIPARKFWKTAIGGFNQPHTAVPPQKMGIGNFEQMAVPS